MYNYHRFKKYWKLITNNKNNMQTIIYNSFADGYFELYRGGADIINNEIVGKDKYSGY